MTFLNNLTHSLVSTAAKLDRVDHYSAIKEQLEKAHAALLAEAFTNNLSDPFTEGGEIRTELVETNAATDFRSAEALLDEAKGDRDTLLKGAAITAGVVTGAALGGLAVREVRRRGWLPRIGEKAEKKAFELTVKKPLVKMVTAAYGELSGLATRLVLDDQVAAVIPLDEKHSDACDWAVEPEPTLSPLGFIFTVSDDEETRFLVPFYAIEAVEKMITCRNGKEFQTATLHVNAQQIIGDKEEETATA